MFRVRLQKDLKHQEKKVQDVLDKGKPLNPEMAHHLELRTGDVFYGAVSSRDGSSEPIHPLHREAYVSDFVVSSVRVASVSEVHAILVIYNRGALSGSITVEARDAGTFLARLLLSNGFFPQQPSDEQ